MKIKEAIKIINSTKTAVAGLWKEKIYFYANDGVDKFDWFLMMPPKANNWNDVEEDFEALYSITPKDLARVMDVIQRLLDTPVKERFPEKKYRLRWLDSTNPFLRATTYLGRVVDNELGNYYWSTFPDYSAELFTEDQLKKMKRGNPKLAPAIDAMKEEVKDDAC